MSSSVHSSGSWDSSSVTSGFAAASVVAIANASSVRTQSDHRSPRQPALRRASPPRSLRLAMTPSGYPSPNKQPLGGRHRASEDSRRRLGDLGLTAVPV